MSKYNWHDESPFKLDLIHDDVPLGNIKQIHAEWFRAGEMRECLCCGRLVKAYPRRLNSQMVRCLAVLASGSKTSAELIRASKCKAGAGNHHMLARWGLVREIEIPDADNRWQIRPRGRAFLFGAVPIPKYCLIYNDRAWGFSHEVVFVDDCKLDFDLGELLDPQTVRDTEWA